MSRINWDNKKASGNKVSFRILVHISTLFFKFSSFHKKKCWIGYKTYAIHCNSILCTSLYIKAALQHYLKYKS